MTYRGAVVTARLSTTIDIKPRVHFTKPLNLLTSTTIGQETEANAGYSVPVNQGNDQMLLPRYKLSSATVISNLDLAIHSHTYEIPWTSLPSWKMYSRLELAQ